MLNKVKPGEKKHRTASESGIGTTSSPGGLRPGVLSCILIVTTYLRVLLFYVILWRCTLGDKRTESFELTDVRYLRENTSGKACL